MLFMLKVNLKRLYDDYNRRYFDNKLPKQARIVPSRRMPKRSALGTTEYNPKYGEQAFCVKINYKLEKMLDIAKLTLLHEMCHIKLLNYEKNSFIHGKQFNQEMRRLANIGAFDGLW